MSDDFSRQLETARLLGEIVAETRNIKQAQAEATVRIEKRLDDMASAMVTKGVFAPVRMVVFGMVALALSAVFTAIILQVVSR